MSDDAVKLARDILENGAREANGSDVEPVRKCNALARAVLDLAAERDRLRAVLNTACDWRRAQSIDHEPGTIERRLVDAVDAAIAD